jgi:hypothetical protein
MEIATAVPHTRERHLARYQAVSKLPTSSHFSLPFAEDHELTASVLGSETVCPTLARFIR